MKLFLLSQLSEDKEFFEKIVEKTGGSLVVETSPLNLCVRWQEEPSALVIVDCTTAQQYTAFEKAVSDRLGLYSAHVNPNNVFFLSSREFHDSPYLSQSEIFGHYIYRGFSDEFADRVAGLFRACSKDSVPGVADYFTNSVKLQTILIDRSEQKRPIVESLKSELIKTGFQSRAAASIATAIDELIMNAIFDAPIDETGKPIYAQTPRSTPLKLDDENLVNVHLALEGEFFAVAVVDKHGSLDKKKLLSHIGKSYQNDQFKVRSSVAGAGLGLSTVFRSCSGMVFTREMGVKTQVILFYRRTKSYKDFKDQSRFLSTMMYFP